MMHRVAFGRHAALWYTWEAQGRIRGHRQGW